FLDCLSWKTQIMLLAYALLALKESARRLSCKVADVGHACVSLTRTGQSGLSSNLPFRPSAVSWFRHCTGPPVAGAQTPSVRGALSCRAFRRLSVNRRYRTCVRHVAAAHVYGTDNSREVGHSELSAEPGFPRPGRGRAGAAAGRAAPGWRGRAIAACALARSKKP